MLFSGRAYYNLLCLERLRGNIIPAEEFETLDYRSFTLDELFKNLIKLNIYFDSDSFIYFCEELDSPEEVGEKLGISEGDGKNEIYLLCFELWRRLLPDKESVSIFCDELDRKIALYEKKKDDNDLLESLQRLVEILDRNCNFGLSPKEIFSRLSMYVAHDLENVIYTYIDSKIKEHTEDDFLGLSHHFMSYVSDKRFLQLLKLKTLSTDFLEEKEKLKQYLVNSLQEDKNSALGQKLLSYLSDDGDAELFKELSSLIKSESE